MSRCLNLWTLAADTRCFVGVCVWCSESRLLSVTRRAGCSRAVPPCQVAQAVVMVVNIEGYDMEAPNLILDRETTVGIFSGNITMWDDERIKRLQSEYVSSRLPSAKITVVVRKDVSGTTDVFKKTLAKCVRAGLARRRLAIPGCRRKGGERCISVYQMCIRWYQIHALTMHSFNLLDFKETTPSEQHLRPLSAVTARLA